MSLIRIETHGQVRTVTLERPEKRNAINPEMMDLLIEAFQAAPGPDERVTVLRSVGPVFCSGLQLSTSGVDANEAIRIEEMFSAVQNYPCPVVAQVQGAAIAGGCELALHCDFIVAADDDDTALELLNRTSERTERLAVEVVGRFIKNDEVRAHPERTAEDDLDLLTT